MAIDEAAYRKALQKIEKAQRSGAKKLDLSHLHGSRDSESLTELPVWLGELTQLQSLNLSYNLLTVLPDWLGQLKLLQSLVLSYNLLTKLPQSLSRLTQLQSLDLSRNELTALPHSLGKLTHLQSLDLSHNRLTALPESLGGLWQLQSLGLSGNQLSALPDWLGRLRQLQSLDARGQQLTSLPASISNLTHLKILKLSDGLGKAHNRFGTLPSIIRNLRSLEVLWVDSSEIESLPDWICELRNLRELQLNQNRLTDLPVSIARLANLKKLVLNANPLNPELAAAYKEGFDAVKRYLNARAEAQVVLNEAKLILIGEGEVGKSCLLGALRGDPWEEGRPTTHGIEIKPVMVTDPDSGTEIKLNGWDFGGQRVYQTTHQLFFSSPAVYLVIWKPREGPQQGFVTEWIKLVKHREPDAKILVVATHGGPNERKPDIDRQEIWDQFGRDTLIDFFHVDSKPDKKTKVRHGIEELKTAIARVAVSLPEMGRSIPKRWDDARKVLRKIRVAYLPLDQVLKLCKNCKMDEEESKDFVRISHRLGHLIHYEHDPALRDIVILKPDWLSAAISYVLDDKQTRDNHGLVEFIRLGQLWNDQARPAESRYNAGLHTLFLRLMERFDLSYKVAVPTEPEDALGFWHRMSKFLGTGKKPPTELHYTSLIAQLVPDVRPDPIPGWSACTLAGDEQQVQICRIVEARNGQSAPAEGLFYQLIVRLHKYSLGRVNYKDSVHWQRGLMLDDDYNGRALLEHIGNDVRITVRAAYPKQFLSVLTHEVKWLVESFWAGLRCDVMVPCIKPCGRNAPGTGLFEVQKLIESKKSGRLEYPCPVCNEWQDIDCLLRNAPAVRRMPVEELQAEFSTVKVELSGMRQQLVALHGEAIGRFDSLEVSAQRILSKVDDAFTGLMQALTDEAKEGPRLFSFEPVEQSRFNPNGWIKKRFRITLWCERTRLPLPLLNKLNPRWGVYEFDIPREWFVQAAPFLKVLTGTLSLVLPVAASAAKLGIEEQAYKAMENQLGFGKDCLDAMLKAGEKALEWAGENDGPELESVGVIRAHGAVLRQLQAWLMEKDPSFGGLVRVQNKRQEFLWVHPDFEKEY